MTAKEAQFEIDRCERDISHAHTSLCSAARDVGSSAEQSIAGKRIGITLLPLIISLVGCFLMENSTSTFLLGLLLIALGIAIAFFAYAKVDAVLTKVKEAQATLNSTIDNNLKI